MGEEYDNEEWKFCYKCKKWRWFINGVMCPGCGTDGKTDNENYLVGTAN